jgi:uncharacterized membrane protein YkvA (DUF1232 family)
MSTERKPVVTEDQAGALTQLVRTVRLVWRLTQDPRVPTWPKFILPAAVLYVLSPIDLLPDFILGLGQVDDIAILFLAVGLFVELCPAHVVQEHRQALSGSDARQDPPDPNVVEGTYRVVSDDK